MKYFYIILGFDGELYKHVFGGANACNDAIYWPGLATGAISAKFEKAYFHERLSKYSLPGKQQWIEARVKILYEEYKKHNNKNKVCFILASRYVNYEKYGFFDCLAKYFDYPKIIYYFCDIVKKDERKTRILSASGTRNYDLVMTYDPGDARQYELSFVNAPYSLIEADTQNYEPQYDVYFIGAAKDRYDFLLQSFNILVTKGLKCYFYIKDSKEERITKGDSLFQLSKKTLSYDRNLANVRKSRAVLEVTQGGANGNSLRVSESIVFDKYLLTNNQDLKNNELFDSKYMYVFDTFEAFDPAFFSNHVSQENKKYLSIEYFLEKVEALLDENQRSERNV